LVMDIVDGQVVHLDESLRRTVTGDPSSRAAEIKTERITSDRIDELTRKLDSGFAGDVRQALQPYAEAGATWEDAIRQHSRKAPAIGDNDE